MAANAAKTRTRLMRRREGRAFEFKTVLNAVTRSDEISPVRPSAARMYEKRRMAPNTLSGPSSAVDMAIRNGFPAIGLQMGIASVVLDYLLVTRVTLLR